MQMDELLHTFFPSKMRNCHCKTPWSKYISVSCFDSSGKAVHNISEWVFLNVLPLFLGPISFLRSDIDVGQDCQFPIQFIPKVFYRGRGSVKFLHTEPILSLLYRPCFMQRSAAILLEQEEVNLKLLSQSQVHKIVQNVPLHPMLCVAFANIRLGCLCSHYMKPSMKMVLGLILKPKEVRRSAAFKSPESRCPQASASPVILYDFPLHGWVAVLHVAIIPLIVDCGIFSREEISILDLKAPESLKNYCSGPI